MSVAKFEKDIWAEAKKVLNNPKMKLKELREWSTSDITPQDGEIAVFLPELRVYIAVFASCDKRDGVKLDRKPSQMKPKTKKKPTPAADEAYEYIVAEVDCDTLTIKSKLKTNPREACEQHDEDVSDWTEDDIRDLIEGLLELTEDEKKLIKIEYA